jgi:hypothetical protein
MRRRFMFASALVSLTVLAPVAVADQEVTDEVTAPIATSTAGGVGVADNIVITSTGRVTLTSATTPAVTLDSDNTIEQNGGVAITTDDDGGVGVLLAGGNTGGFTGSASIQIISETRPADDDEDGDLDGPGAIGGNRVALLVDGTAVFTGDIIFTSSSTITVLGNDSAGIRILTGLDGTLDFGGRITMAGDRSSGIDIRDNISGDVLVSGTVAVGGEASRGVSVEGDVAGTLAIGGSIATTGYQFVSRPSAAALETLDADDLLQGGSAVYVSGSVGEGVLIHGPTSDDPDVTAAAINTRGTAPAVHVQSTATSGDIVLAEVVIAAVADDPDTTDVDESRAQQHLGYSFVNRGNIVSTGDLDNIDTTALRIEGGSGFTTTLTGGFLNAGVTNSTAYEAVSTGIAVGAGAIIPVWHNTGDMLATSIGTSGTARAFVIESGANLPSLVNDDTIFAYGRLGGSSVAVRDYSGTLTSVANTGIISALYEDPFEGVDAVPYTTVALDLSNATADTTVRQYRRAETDEDTTIAIIGDVMFGSGADQLLVETGEVTGNISFGDGADLLRISSGGAVTGAIMDSDADLAIEVDDGTLTLATGSTAQIREARFGDGSRLLFEIDHDAGIAASLDASGTVTFETGSRISTSLTNLIGDGASYVVLTANALVIEETIEALEDTIAPYLYQASLDFDPNDANALVLTLRRRTADELGMNTNQGQAYSAAYEGWQNNADLGAAIASLTTETDFFNAFDQLLPEYSASAIQFALASNDSAVGALASRLEAVRRSPEHSAGLWIEEFGYFADRAGNAFGPGYRGHGIGVALGVDRPFGPFYAVGVNFVGAASEISEVEGVDEPMSAITSQVGVYAGADLGGMTLDVYGAAGIDSFEHNRRVLINSFDASPMAEWTGYHVAGSARLGRDFRSGRYYIRPSVSIDYLRLVESSYTETGGGDGINLFVDDRESSSFTGTALLTVGSMYQGSDGWWAPHARLGFRGDFSSDAVDTLANFDGYTDTFTLQSQQLPGSGFIFGFGIGAGSGYSTFSLDYDADVRDDFIRHTARLVLRMVF